MGSPDESERNRPGREEMARNWRSAGLPGPDATGVDRPAGTAESLVPVRDNDAARQDVLTGHVSSESVSIRYTHWSKCCCNRKVYILSGEIITPGSQVRIPPPLGSACQEKCLEGPTPAAVSGSEAY